MCVFHNQHLTLDWVHNFMNLFSNDPLRDIINRVEHSQHLRLHDVDQLESRTLRRVAVKMKKHVQALADCSIKQL